MINLHGHLVLLYTFKASCSKFGDRQFEKTAIDWMKSPIDLPKIGSSALRETRLPRKEDERRVAQSV